VSAFSQHGVDPSGAGRRTTVELKLDQMFDDQGQAVGKLTPVPFGQPFDLLRKVVPVDRRQQISRLVLAARYGGPDRTQCLRLADGPGVQILFVQAEGYPAPASSILTADVVSRITQ
jgi:hypothetical protein